MHITIFTLVLLLTAATTTTAQSPATGQLLGHGYVDLGLSVVWATCNIGAESPSDYGDYFAWGEAETKSSYTESNSATYNESSYTFLDAASAQWGSAWRMPTMEECKELIYGCKWQRTTIGCHSGYKVTGPNGNSIFLPATGVKTGTSIAANDQGCLWSSSPYQSDLETASIIFSNATTHDEGYRIRYVGLPVRPIVDLLSEKEKGKRTTIASGQIAGHNYVDLGLSVKWATCNIGASKPEDYGDYFAWGEAKTKSDFTEKNSTTYKKRNYVFNDAARTNWGGTWRMPTKAECQELIDNCTYTFTTVCGHMGYKVTSKKNGNSIFLPCAPMRGAYAQGVEGTCWYWSSSPSPYDDDNRTAVAIRDSTNRTLSVSGVANFRYDGYSIRPVSK